MLKRIRHIIQGQVQGVGFRPFIFRVAKEHGLLGYVTNNPQGVCIEIQGNEESLVAFEQDFKAKLPPLAKISFHEQTEIPLMNSSECTDFIIKHTEEGEHGGHNVLISPDTATCALCEADMFDKENFRYAYAFTNCTNCGPRYSITKSIPYDRAFTSMSCFPLCSVCQEEYDNPMDRRFHAQPNACLNCGPSLWFSSVKDANNFSEKHLNESTQYHAIKKCLQAVHRGDLVAIKGLGGFQIACDAYNKESVNRLRQRKNRPHKPFAVMVKNIETAKKIAHITKEAEELLLSPYAPIVLCPQKNGALPETVAPHNPRIGIMLAYTPLHKLLFSSEIFDEATQEKSTPQVMIMTSANQGGEPICISNRQAVEKLSGFVDYFLFHNRDILVRVDDSVCLALDSGLDTEFETEPFSKPKILFFRRARGYVPNPQVLPLPSNTVENVSLTVEEKLQKPTSILAVGAFLKNTFCLTKNNQAFVSQHIGDLDNLAVMEFYEETFEHLKKLLEVEPQAVVCDLHPDFPSSQFAKDFAEKNNIPLWELGHHYAHVYAVLAEQEDYDLSGTLALVLDGTGLGTDGNIWGGELLYLNPKTETMLRLGRLSPMVLAGGDAATKEPWRISEAMAQRCLQKGYIANDEWEALPLPHMENPIFAQQTPMINMMLEKNLQCFQSSACGRLFDAVSSLLDICHLSTFEGQAPIDLEGICHGIKQAGIGKKYSLILEKICDQIHAQQQIVAENTFIVTDSSSNLPIFIAENVQREKIIKNERISLHDNLSYTNTQSLNIVDFSTPVWEIDSHALYATIFKLIAQNIPKAELASLFHALLAENFISLAKKAGESLGVKSIVLCGGVMNNERLLTTLCSGLSKESFKLMLPQNMPSGDGAISLGQAYFATLRLMN